MSNVMDFLKENSNALVPQSGETNIMDKNLPEENLFLPNMKIAHPIELPTDSLGTKINGGEFFIIKDEAILNLGTSTEVVPLKKKYKILILKDKGFDSSYEFDEKTAVFETKEFLDLCKRFKIESTIKAIKDFNKSQDTYLIMMGYTYLVFIPEIKEYAELYFAKSLAKCTNTFESALRVSPVISIKTVKKEYKLFKWWEISSTPIELDSVEVDMDTSVAKNWIEKFSEAKNNGSDE